MAKLFRVEIKTLEAERGNIGTSLRYFLSFNFPKDAKVLDLGCNFGSLIYNLRKEGYKNVYGIDIVKDSIDKGKARYPEIKEKLIWYEGEKLPYGDNSFDVILMFDVIEHILGVEEFMKSEVARCLKGGGKLVFQTPNKPLNIAWEVVNKRSLTAWRKDHCSLQTISSLRSMLEEAGFSEVDIHKYDIYTEHNIKKVRSKLGPLGVPILKLLSLMPLSLSTNLWGNARL